MSFGGGVANQRVEAWSGSQGCSATYVGSSVLSSDTMLRATTVLTCVRYRTSALRRAISTWLSLCGELWRAKHTDAQCDVNRVYDSNHLRLISRWALVTLLRVH